MVELRELVAQQQEHTATRCSRSRPSGPRASRPCSASRARSTRCACARRELLRPLRVALEIGPVSNGDPLWDEVARRRSPRTTSWATRSATSTRSTRRPSVSRRTRAASTRSTRSREELADAVERAARDSKHSGARCGSRGSSRRSSRASSRSSSSPRDQGTAAAAHVLWLREKRASNAQAPVQESRRAVGPALRAPRRKQRDEQRPGQRAAAASRTRARRSLKPITRACARWRRASSAGHARGARAGLARGGSSEAYSNGVAAEKAERPARDRARSAHSRRRRRGRRDRMARRCPSTWPLAPPRHEREPKERERERGRVHVRPPTSSSAYSDQQVPNAPRDRARGEAEAHPEVLRPRGPDHLREDLRASCCGQTGVHAIVMRASAKPARRSGRLDTGSAGAAPAAAPATARGRGRGVTAPPAQAAPDEQERPVAARAASLKRVACSRNTPCGGDRDGRDERQRAHAREEQVDGAAGSSRTAR